MKISKQRLDKLIKEEIKNLLSEDIWKEVVLQFPGNKKSEAPPSAGEQDSNGTVTQIDTELQKKLNDIKEKLGWEIPRSEHTAKETFQTIKTLVDSKQEIKEKFTFLFKSAEQEKKEPIPKPEGFENLKKLKRLVDETVSDIQVSQTNILELTNRLKKATEGKVLNKHFKKMADEINSQLEKMIVDVFSSKKYFDYLLTIEDYKKRGIQIKRDLLIMANYNFEERKLYRFFAKTIQEIESEEFAAHLKKAITKKRNPSYIDR